ncbi:MAG: hypothetical protein GXY83_36160 [Rhodopirellula sp.]|nr:hypothetical protein [Rhodopirellula sp.]
MATPDQMDVLPAKPDRPALQIRLDERQARIHRRLSLIGPGPAAYLEDACALMDGRLPIASTAHLVGHLLREIESSIRAVLKTAASSDSPARSDKQNHARQVEQVLAFLEVPKGDPVETAWFRLCSDDTYALSRLAHRDSLAPPRPVDDGFRTFWSEMLTILDVVLDRFETRYLAFMPTLDGLLIKQHPTRGDAATLKNNVPNNVATLGHFFSKLDNARWLEPLRQEGFFARPPQPIVNEEEQTISFPPWPLTRFLQRMASQEPALVAEIAAEIPMTDNTSVHLDLLETALALPPELAGRLVPQLKHAVECSYQGLLFTHQLGKLLLHIAADPQNCTAGLELARAAFALVPESEQAEEPTARPLRFSKPRTRMDLHEYERIVASTTKELASHFGVPTFEMFCDLLEEAISSEQDRDDASDREDWSYIWCQDVERCSGAHDVRSALVSAVRDAAVCLLESGRMEIGGALQLLEARQWKAFDRVGLYLLRRFPDNGLIKERLMQEESFDDRTLRREYNNLMEAYFERLGHAEQTAILGWIEAGPNLEEYCDGCERVFGHRPTEEEAHDHAERWRLEHLQPIRDSLPDAWQERYGSLIGQFGVPQLYPPTSTFSWGWKSPLEVDEIRSMGNTEIISYLKTWTPPQDEHFGPCRKGLADALQRIVTEEPERFIAAADELTSLHPAYLSAMLAGLREAARKTWQEDRWAPILRLCSSIVAQTGDAEEYAADEERAGRWLRQSVASLVGFGLEQHDAQFPFELWKQIWTIVLALTDDPDPTQNSESPEDDGNVDPMTQSLDTVRGEAMHAVIKYALWVRRHREKRGNQCTSFDEMPEVRDVLNRHLDLSRDASPAIRTVYGQWFPWLCMLDETWAASHVDAIFPTDPAHVTLWDAAWQPYIVFCPPYNGVFQVLRKHYEHAILDIEREAPYKVAGNADHREQLAEHLMLFYGRGVITVDDSPDIIDLFFAKAPQSVRYHALEFVGRSLKNEDGQVPAEVIERFKKLWERRVHALKSFQNPMECSELRAFGWWFICAKFDRAWCVEHLRQALQLCGWAEPDHLVVEHLEAIAGELPSEAVDSLSQLVDGDKNGWGVSSWREHAATILRTALDSRVEEARNGAAALINRLCARGFHDYRSLLDGR